MYIFFDTETTGFPRGGSSFDPDQARVCQIAAILADKNLDIVDEYKTVIKPHNWTISKGAYDTHGISQEECERIGVHSHDALKRFLKLALCSKYLIAHHAKFDRQMLKIECEVHGEVVPEFDRVFCTMLLTKNAVGAHDKNGRVKNPSLVDAYKHIFDEDLADAHDAMADTKGCMRIFKHLKEIGKIHE